MALPNTSAPGAVNMQDIIANFKEVYGQFRDLVPSELKFSKLVKFAGGDKQIGNEFHEPVVLSMEGGVTYGGSGGAVFDLNKYVALTVQDAKVKSSEMVLRSAISVAAVARSANDKNSFKRGLQLLIGNMMKSMYHRLEVALLYGQEGLGVVEDITFSPGGDNTKALIKIEDAEWAAGIWTGTNKHKVDALTATLSAKRAVPGGVVYIIDSYDFDNRTVTIQGIDSTNTPVDISTSLIVATDKLFFHGEVTAGGTPVHYNIMGLKKIAETRGALFSIDNSTLPLFQGNLVDCGTDANTPAYLDFMTIERSAARGVEKGVTDQKMTAMCSVHSWNDLLEDQAAKRRYSGSEVGKLKEGGQELEFYGQTGAIQIIPSTYVKEGYAFTFCEKDLIRIGAYDVTMEPPGHQGEPIRYLEDGHGYQARVMSDQCLFTSRPGGISVIRYVTNSRLNPSL